MFTTRNGEISEIENFDLFDADNEGEEILVVEYDGCIVGYAQYNSGRAIIDWFKGWCFEVTAVNAVETAQPFYSHMGFVPNGRPAYTGQINMTWWDEE